MNGLALASLSDQGIADARQVIDGPVEGLVMGVPLSDPSCNTLHCNPPTPDNMTCGGRDILFAQSLCNQVTFPLTARLSSTLACLLGTLYCMVMILRAQSGNGYFQCEESHVFCAECIQQCDMLCAERGDFSVYAQGCHEGRCAVQLAISSGILRLVPGDHEPDRN